MRMDCLAVILMTPWILFKSFEKVSSGSKFFVLFFLLFTSQPNDTSVSNQKSTLYYMQKSSPDVDIAYVFTKQSWAMTLLRLYTAALI